MDDSPKLHYLIIPVMLGLVAGVPIALYLTQDMLSYKRITTIMIILLFGGLGWWMSSWFIGKREDWAFGFNVDSPFPMPKMQENSGQVISITIPELGQKLVRGLELDEWKTLAHGMVERGYHYTTRDLQDIFGPQRGNIIYGRITQPLLDAGILVPSGSNGVAVTDHVGRHFFAQLDKNDYKVIELVPHPRTESA
jgi:hypothetical protein